MVRCWVTVPAPTTCNTWARASQRWQCSVPAVLQPTRPRHLPALPPTALSSPGPMTANPASSMGRQLLSTKASAGSIGFGSSRRLAEHANDSPGPGAYYA